MKALHTIGLIEIFSQGCWYQSGLSASVYTYSKVVDEMNKVTFVCNCFFSLSRGYVKKQMNEITVEHYLNRL